MTATSQIAGKASGSPQPIRIGLHGDQMPEPKAVLSSSNTRYPATGEGVISYLFANPGSEAVIDIKFDHSDEVTDLGVKGTYPCNALWVEWKSGTLLTVY